MSERELLCAFFLYFRDNGEQNIGMTIEEFVDEFLAVLWLLIGILLTIQTINYFWIIQSKPLY